jgi:Protein of unknown function (DUF3313)
MLIKPALVLSLIFCVSGCAQLDEWTSTTPKRDESASTTDPGSSGATVYVTEDAPPVVADYRNVYIAPANLANMQVIQPEGAPAHPEWWVTDDEADILQRVIAYEFSIALTSQSDFTIVTSASQAQLVINTAVVAVHPNETRASVARGARPSGSITVSIAVVNAATGKVLVRTVDTRSSEDIWAFNEVQGDDPAVNSVFQSLGSDIRRGILQLQGRPDQAEGQPRP